MLVETRRSTFVTVRPKEYEKPLRNPLMGFRSGLDSTPNKWATLVKHYIEWNKLEERGEDTAQRITAFCDSAWAGLPKRNLKVVPRVYLEWPGRGKYWPTDITEGDYSSPAFERRAVRMVEKLGQAWDKDGRVAFVEMGIIGLWGEQHTPSVSPRMQKLLGDAFRDAFRNKPVMVRHPWDFPGMGFGIYWDSWAHQDQMSTHGAGIAKLVGRWQIAPMGGECAYDWGSYRIQPGDSPTDTVKNPLHRRFLTDTIRSLHCNHLGWVSDYDVRDDAARVGAAEVQKAFGYRFVVSEARYPASVSPGESFLLTLLLQNTGSSPLYADWRLEVSLVVPDRRHYTVIWKQAVKGVDVRRWLPGDQWDSATQRYRTPAPINTVQIPLTLPRSAPPGDYALCIALLDPAGNLPTVQFAIRGYFKGGRHPLGMIRVGKAAAAFLRPELPSAAFDDPGSDDSLFYSA